MSSCTGGALENLSRVEMLNKPSCVELCRCQLGHYVRHHCSFGVLYLAHSWDLPLRHSGLAGACLQPCLQTLTTSYSYVGSKYRICLRCLLRGLLISSSPSFNTLRSVNLFCTPFLSFSPQDTYSAKTPSRDLKRHTRSGGQLRHVLGFLNPAQSAKVALTCLQG